MISNGIDEVWYYPKNSMITHDEESTRVLDEMGVKFLETLGYITFYKCPVLWSEKVGVRIVQDCRLHKVAPQQDITPK